MVRLGNIPGRGFLTMSKFDPNRLNIEYILPANVFGPIERRKYTLTHSDIADELCLTIGKNYNSAAINPKLRDEVLAEWQTRNGEYLLMGKVYISSGEYDEKFAKIRYLIFKRELNLALTGIVYGDQGFYINYPWLLDSPILVQFDSDFPQYNDIIYCGTPRQYLIAATTDKSRSKTQA